MGTITVKEYDSINILCHYTDEVDDIGINISTVDITSDIMRLSGQVIHSFDVEITDEATGQFALKLDGGVLLKGTYLIDIMFNRKDKSRTVSSDTFKLVVNKSVTKWR